MVLPRRWSKQTAFAFGVAAIALALVIDDGGGGQDRRRSFAPVVSLFSRRFNGDTGLATAAVGSNPAAAAAASPAAAAAASTATAVRRGLSGATTAPPSLSDHADDSGGAHHAEGADDNGLLFVSLFIGLGVILNFLLDAAGKYFPLPYTVALVLLGAVVGALNSIGECHQLTGGDDPHAAAAVNCSGLKHARCQEYSEHCAFESALPSQLGMLGTSIDTWVDMDPGFLLFFFIPALVYASAHTVDVHIFRESFVNVLTLAVPGVLMATYMMFAFFYFVYGDNPRYGWSFDACMCFGAILAATDPVAVVALLNDLGAPHKLSIAIEGESLLNDGTALVLFTIFADALVSIERSIGDQFLFFFRLSLGGVGAGIVAGVLSILCFAMMTSALQETTWTIGAAYLTFFLCENANVHFSGVLGVVFLGITISLYGRTRLEDVKFMLSFWSMWNFIANTLIFSITGAIVAESIFFEDYVQPEDWATLVVVYCVQMLVRLLVLVVLSPVLYWSGRRNGYQLDAKELTLIWWSGLRGAVGLILALEVALAPAATYVEDQLRHCPNLTASDDPDCAGHWYIIGSGSVEDVRRFQALLTFFVAGFATLTLIVNGLTTRFVVGCLGLTRKSRAHRFAYEAATRQLEELMRDEVEDRLKKDPLYRHADWARVWRAIPVHTWAEPACGRVRLAPFGKHWHQALDDGSGGGAAAVDPALGQAIAALEAELKKVAGRLDDAKEMRRNQILGRITFEDAVGAGALRFPDSRGTNGGGGSSDGDDHGDAGVLFDELFELFEAWALGKGKAAASMPEGGASAEGSKQQQQPGAGATVNAAAATAAAESRRASAPPTTGTGARATAAAAGGVDAAGAQQRMLIRSYSYDDATERPFVLGTAFPAGNSSDNGRGGEGGGVAPEVAFVKKHWGVLQELRRRFLMLVSAHYWTSFEQGFVTADAVQDLQEVSRHCTDNVVKHARAPVTVEGFRDHARFHTLEELAAEFAVDDWPMLVGKFTRCQPSVRRCCNAHSEALRRSKFLDALSAHRAAHEHALGVYRERYQRAMRKLDYLRAAGDKASASALIFLGQQVVEDHPLFLDLVMRESEAVLARVREKIDEVQMQQTPNALATHQAVMHLLAVQTHAIHHMLEKGLIDHEEEQKLLAGVSQLKSDTMLQRMAGAHATATRITPVTQGMGIGGAGPRSRAPVTTATAINDDAPATRENEGDAPPV